MENYQRFWDGSESGWKVCQYKESVWLLEFTFDESGPTEEEFSTIVDFFPPHPSETLHQMREKFRDCFGWATGCPVSSATLELLKESGLRMSTTEVKAESHLVLMPDDRHYFIPDASLREEVAKNMVDAGINVEIREIS